MKFEEHTCTWTCIR